MEIEAGIKNCSIEITNVQAIVTLEKDHKITEMITNEAVDNMKLAYFLYKYVLLTYRLFAVSYHCANDGYNRNCSPTKFTVVMVSTQCKSSKSFMKSQ